LHLFSLFFFFVSVSIRFDRPFSLSPVPLVLLSLPAFVPHLLTSLLPPPPPPLISEAHPFLPHPTRAAHLKRDPPFFCLFRPRTTLVFLVPPLHSGLSPPQIYVPVVLFRGPFLTPACPLSPSQKQVGDKPRLSVTKVYLPSTFWFNFLVPAFFHKNPPHPPMNGPPLFPRSRLSVFSVFVSCCVYSLPFAMLFFSLFRF